MKFQNCYKKLINSFCDWTQWANLGLNATYLFGLLDKCSASTDERVTIYSYRPVASDMIGYWLGNGGYSSQCYPGKFWNYWPFAIYLLEAIVGPHPMS